ncbi:ribbon-helix-helix domain-containing protein, partial [Pseudomonas aeruginosa]
IHSSAASDVYKRQAKKVPYTLLMPPDQLEALRNLAEKDDTSVSHHIRQAVRAYLRTRLV